MSLPIGAIDRLWERLLGTYGNDLRGKYTGMDPGSVKAVWAHELAGFAGRLQAVAWALENLPEFPPNAIQFRNLCRRAPGAEPAQLPEPEPDQARLDAELARLGGTRQALVSRPDGPRLEWVKALALRQTLGKSLTLTQRRMLETAQRKGGEA